MSDAVRLSAELSFPVDLDTILSVSLDFDKLKVVLDFILSVLRKQQAARSPEKIESLEERLKAQEIRLSVSERETAELKALAAETDLLAKSNKEEIDQLRNDMKQIDISPQKSDGTGDSDSLRNLIQINKEAIEQLRKDLNQFDASHYNKFDVDALINQLRNDLKEFDSTGHNTGDSDKLLNLININKEAIEHLRGDLKLFDESHYNKPETDALIDQLRKELKLLEESLKNKVDIGDFEGLRILTQNNKDAIEQLRKVFKQFDESLRNKVDSDDFDNLRNLLNSGAKSSGTPSIAAGGLSTKDSNLLKDLKRRLDEMESQSEQQPKSSDSLEEIFSRLMAVERTLKINTGDVEDLKGKTIKLRTDVDRLFSELREFENSRPAGDLSTSASTTGVGGGTDNAKLNRLARRVDVIEEELRGLSIPPGMNLGAILEEIKKLWAAIEELRGLFDKLGKEFRNRMKELENRMNDSISSSVLSDFEKNILQRLEELGDALGKKFADKQETRKALRHLDKLIRDIYEESPGKREGDDALLARKPLGGWSCASCEKGLEKLIGRVAPYTPWNKMPYRDPADRIARVGPGFSRMLATVQPEMMSTRSRQVGQKIRQTEYEYDEEHIGNTSEVVTLPPVKSNDRPFTAAMP